MTGQLIIHNQRFFTPARIVGLEDRKPAPLEYLDVRVGQKVDLIETKHGQFLCHFEGYYKWVDASWVK